jgi:predicted nucleotidyltransferase
MVAARSYSGKFVLRVGPALHRRLAAQARAAGQSLNEHCACRLAAGPPAMRFASLGLDDAIVSSLVNAFNPRPLGVVLFGSVARGEQTETSDMDLLVVLADGIRPTRELYRDLERKVDLTALRPAASLHLVSMPPRVDDGGSLWFEVALDGVVLWEQGAQISSRLREVRQHISEGRRVRKHAYGHPYWVREAARP